MKHSKLLDAAIVAAMLLAYVPGLAAEIPVESTPAALILTAEETQSTSDNPAERL